MGLTNPFGRRRPATAELKKVVSDTMDTFNSVDRGLPGPFSAPNVVTRHEPGYFARLFAGCCSVDTQQVDAPSPMPAVEHTHQPYLRSGVIDPVSIEITHNYAIDVLKSVVGDLSIFSLPASLCAVFGRLKNGLTLRDARHVSETFTEQYRSMALEKFKILDYARDAIETSMRTGRLCVGAVCTVVPEDCGYAIHGVVISVHDGRALVKKNGLYTDHSHTRLIATHRYYVCDASIPTDFSYGMRLVTAWDWVVRRNMSYNPSNFCIDPVLVGTTSPMMWGNRYGGMDPYGARFFDRLRTVDGAYRPNYDFARHNDFRFGFISPHDVRAGEMFDHRKLSRLFDVSDPRFDISDGRAAILGAVERYVMLVRRENPALNERPATDVEIAAANYAFINKLKALRALGGDSVKPLEERPTLGSLPVERIVFNSSLGKTACRLPSEAELCNTYIHGATPAIEQEVYFLAGEALRSVSGFHIRSAIIRGSIVTAGQIELLRAYQLPREYGGLNPALRKHVGSGDGRTT